jgi:tryptophan synthase alpha chain
VSRIGEVFHGLKSRGEKALIAYITAGDPDLETTVRLVKTMEENGADIVELGIPFSDPLADGATIQRASVRGLKSGATLRNVIDMVAELRREVSVPIVFMTYYNPIHQYGEAGFVERSVAAGVDGVIVPDMPPEESESLRRLSGGAGFDVIYLVAPTTAPERIELICDLSSGFVYYVSLTGVTGERREVAAGLRDGVSRVKAVTHKPVAVGFGISTPRQVREVSKWADGVVVGSAIVKLIEENKERMTLERDVGSFVRSLKESTRLDTGS